MNGANFIMLIDNFSKGNDKAKFPVEIFKISSFLCWILICYSKLVQVSLFWPCLSGFGQISHFSSDFLFLNKAFVRLKKFEKFRTIKCSIQDCIAKGISSFKTFKMGAKLKGLIVFSNIYKETSFNQLLTSLLIDGFVNLYFFSSLKLPFAYYFVAKITDGFEYIIRNNYSDSFNYELIKNLAFRINFGKRSLFKILPIETKVFPKKLIPGFRKILTPSILIYCLNCRTKYSYRNINRCKVCNSFLPNQLDFKHSMSLKDNLFTQGNKKKNGPWNFSRRNFQFYHTNLPDCPLIEFQHIESFEILPKLSVLEQFQKRVFILNKKTIFTKII